MNDPMIYNVTIPLAVLRRLVEQSTKLEIIEHIVNDTRLEEKDDYIDIRRLLPILKDGAEC